MAQGQRCDPGLWEPGSGEKPREGTCGCAGEPRGEGHSKERAKVLGRQDWSRWGGQQEKGTS